MSEQKGHPQEYPITFNTVYPEKMSRLTTFFRLILRHPSGNSSLFFKPSPPRSCYS